LGLRKAVGIVQPSTPKNHPVSPREAFARFGLDFQSLSCCVQIYYHRMNRLLIDFQSPSSSVHHDAVGRGARLQSFASHSNGDSTRLGYIDLDNLMLPPFRRIRKTWSPTATLNSVHLFIYVERYVLIIPNLILF
jgi:hypothetical protein